MPVSLQDEVRGAALGDERLTKRLGKLIEQLGAKPNMSVPAATRGRAEMEAAYRFFDNDKVSPGQHPTTAYRGDARTDLTNGCCAAGSRYNRYRSDSSQPTGQRSWTA